MLRISKSLILMIAFFFLSCRREHTFENNNSNKKVQKLKMHKLEKLFVIGDFNGDKKLDTLFEHNFSNLNKKEIELAPDPYQNNWETVVDWFYKQESSVYLSTNENKGDKLNFSTAQGLYCLINIGDNNFDGKDEIALVLDLCDYSRINSCKIYTLCKNKWKKIKQFGIHEDSFDYRDGKKPIKYFEIKNYLENHNGKWFYKDNSQIDYETQDQVGKMNKLELVKCE